MDNIRRKEEAKTQIIHPITQKEIPIAIKNNINPKNAPGLDLLTGEILKQLPQKR
jgi:hypothetical protein